MDPIDELDRWLRGDFVRINTALEELYFAERIDVICGRPDVDALKRAVASAGRSADGAARRHAGATRSTRTRVIACWDSSVITLPRVSGTKRSPPLKAPANEA